MKISDLSKMILAALCVFYCSAFAQYWTGNGGSGIRLAVLEPEGKGISENDQWMLSLIQGSIIGDFNKFSKITIVDRQKIETIMTEQKEAMSARYSDENRIQIGNLTNASHILTGIINKTPNAFTLELSVTDLQSGERKASYPPMPVSTASLENLSAIKEASTSLLTQLGVNLTSAAFEELKQTANVARIQAEEAFARGIVAKRQGTEVAALSYFYQAAALDKSLLEAASRSSVIAANIKSGNIGADTRNKIQWRNDWVARLTETEQFFDNLFNTKSLPYTLFYETGIIEGDINYQAGTQTLSIKTKLSASSEWLSSIEKSLQAVYDGLDATKMKTEWGLQNWPWTSVTGLNPFENKYKTFSIVAELVNGNNKVIGTANFQSESSLVFNGSGRPTISICEYKKRVNFVNVNANDITDNFTIRIASVNGIDANTAAQTGVLQIKAIPPMPKSRPETKVISGIECVLIKAGTFIMGSPENEANRINNETQHYVTLTKDYWISKYPITNAQYKGSGTNHPIVNVNWTQADAWARSKGGRLPTEAEWEFAARGGNESEGYIYSGSDDLDKVGWYKNNSGGGTKPIGQKKPNELGIYDMNGNVWEWCDDWYYGEYPIGAVTNPTGPSTGVNRVIRGGCWDYPAQNCRVAIRADGYPPVSNDHIGFRVVFPRN